MDRIHIDRNNPDSHMVIDSPNRALEIVFLSYENAISTSITLPMELFNAAATLSKSKAIVGSRAPSAKLPRIRAITVSKDGESKMTHSGIRITENRQLSDVRSADILYLPGLWRNPFPVIRRNQEIVEWIKHLYHSSETKLVGVGTGCCFLAEAGLLDDRIATTHWYFFERFQRRYPKVNLQQNYFITQSGRLYCAGSVNTLADLTVHFIEKEFGPLVSAEVERHFFHDVRQNYAKLALVENLSGSYDDELVVEVQERLLNRIGDTVDIAGLADELGMSRRNLDRRFKASTGTTPLKFLQKQKMEMARDLIKNSNLSINEIMYKLGYQDASHFSSLFKTFNGTTPKQYRRTVRSKLFNP